MNAGPTIRDVLTDCFGSVFGDGSWTAWRSFLAAVFALPMSEAEADVYRRCTGRTALPAVPAREAWMIVGRRGGKSRVAALLAVYLGCFRRYRLAIGERAVVAVIAADRSRARVIFRYVAGLIKSVPMLRATIARETAEEIELTSGVAIEVQTSSFTRTRGRTYAAVICDEIAFWETDEDAAEPGSEVLNALRPGMATIPGALLIALSSPYARQGELWNAYRDHFGKDGDVLVWQAATRIRNSTVPQSIIDRALEKDAAVASAEYLAEFRRDVESFITHETIDGVIIPGRVELPRVTGNRYVAFVDPSGGSADAMTLAIAHRDEKGRAVLDAVRDQTPPFSPDATVAEFARVIHGYGVYQVEGDRYAGEWPREGFRRYGISYRVSERPRSDLYRDLLPLLNSRSVELLDVPKLTAQLIGLERRTARGGRDSIDHAPGRHDDVANAAAGALTLAAGLHCQGGAAMVQIVEGGEQPQSEDERFALKSWW